MFIDSMQIMNYSADKLVKILSDEDFTELVKEFGSKNIELLKLKTKRCLSLRAHEQF